MVLFETNTASLQSVVYLLIHITGEGLILRTGRDGHYLSRARRGPETDIVKPVLAVRLAVCVGCLSEKFVRACTENLVNRFWCKFYYCLLLWSSCANLSIVFFYWGKHNICIKYCLQQEMHPFDVHRFCPPPVIFYPYFAVFAQVEVSHRIRWNLHTLWHKGMQITVIQYGLEFYMSQA